jgi:trans-aconitate methyltransferase
MPSHEWDAGHYLKFAAARPDVVFANAALQWVGGHERLVPRLFFIATKPQWG